ncbi:MAG TPA: hypothetical protein VFJ97_00465 [Dermatophilaceae bacterium]|nr:hypothetical protein [Dermatophilaceae bacterium]
MSMPAHRSMPTILIPRQAADVVQVGDDAAASMSATAFEIDQKRVQQVAPLVVAAAREVSQALGYRASADPGGAHRAR